MYLDLDDLKEYPDYGTFTKVEGDGYNMPEKPTIVYQGECDIQMITPEIGQVGTRSNYVVIMPMPLDENGKLHNPIRKEMDFEGIRFGEKIGGKVLNAEPSQLGGITVYIERTIWAQ